MDKYPFSAVRRTSVATVERTLLLPSWHWTHDQGYEGSCVGHGEVMERAITNIAQAKARGLTSTSRRYNPLWSWDRAKEIDEWEDTNPGDDQGTSVRAAYDVARTLGVQPVYSMRLGDDGIPVAVRPRTPDPAEGVSVNRWATTVDEMRTAIAAGRPVVIGVTWYSRFDTPLAMGYQEWWAAKDGDRLGTMRGGHALCVYGASDRRQAFKLKNSWGKDYPLAWMSYGVMQMLLDDYGEACLTTDR